MATSHITFNTTSIDYNYAIARVLYDRVGVKDTQTKSSVYNYIKQLVISQVKLLDKYFSENTDKIDKIRNIMFKTTKLSGSTGVTTTRETSVISEGKKILTPITTIDQINNVIKTSNIRELMTMIKNFASADNDCNMYSLLVEYDKTIKPQRNDGKIDEFKIKYPMLNTTTMEKSITLIEDIIGFNIEFTGEKYKPDDINGSNPQIDDITGVTPINDNAIPYYKVMQDYHKKNNIKSPITLCWLWHPLVYGVPYQDIVKLPVQNMIRSMVDSYEPTDKQGIDSDFNCMNDIFRKYEIFPPLSDREKRFIKTITNRKQQTSDGIVIPAYNPPICYMKAKHKDTPNFTLNMLKRFNKYSVSNFSGHVMLFITVASYFNIQVDERYISIDKRMIVIACIIYMVPYNHSIHEIFQAAKMMGVFPEYNIRKTDLENLNTLIELIWGDGYQIPKEELNVIINKLNPTKPRRGGVKIRRNTKIRNKTKKLHKQHTKRVKNSRNKKSRKE